MWLIFQRRPASAKRSAFSGKDKHRKKEPPMNQKVTLQGREYPVTFTLRTMIGFENIVGHSFFNDKFETVSSRMALVIAAIVSADKDADIRDERLMGTDSWDGVRELFAAYNTVMELASEFFHVPAVEQQDDKPENGETSKN